MLALLVRFNTIGLISPRKLSTGFSSPSLTSSTATFLIVASTGLFTSPAFNQRLGYSSSSFIAVTVLSLRFCGVSVPAPPQHPPHKRRAAGPKLVREPAPRE